MAALAANDPLPASALTKLVPDLALQLRIAVGKKYEGTVGVSTRMLFLMSTEGDIVRTRPLGTWLSSQYRWTTAEQWIGGLARDRAGGRPRRARPPVARRVRARHDRGHRVVDEVDQDAREGGAGGGGRGGGERRHGR